MAMKAKDPEEGYVSACYWIQRKLHEKVDENYPVAKLMVALEELQKEAKEQEKASKGKGGRRTLSK